jgi:hypothetical protein
MKHPLLLAALLGMGLSAHAQKDIYCYAIGNWRNGPTVVISPLFGTTEQRTTPQLIAQVRGSWPDSFTDSTDIDVQRFATREEGEESRTTLQRKFLARKLQVQMLEMARAVEERPTKPPHNE